MNDKLLQKMRRRLRARRGQSMAAYALISAALLSGATVMVAKIIPGLLNGIDAYARSLYLGLNLPFP